MTKSFDVFLSHNSKDKPAVRELAEALRSRGLKVWLDEWELVPGRPWQEALEEIIETTGASVVLVGKDGIGPWQDAELRGCLSEFVERKLPVIPVLLPGAPEVPRLPFFLKRFTWVDLRGGLEEEGIEKLQWGITGERPSARPATADIRARIQEDATGDGGGVILLPRQEKAPSRLEVLAHRHSSKDRFFLIPLEPDLTLLAAFLSDIEVINHDDKPTELLRLWVGITKPESQDEITPREVKEEKLIGTRRIEARSRRRYRLHFKAVFRELIPRQDGPQRVFLYVKTIGLGTQQVKLGEAFFPCGE